MEAHQKLEVFLPKLRIKLIRSGMSEETASHICEAVRAGDKQPPITTVHQYHQAWAVCHIAEEILTTVDDGSEAAAWCTALAHSIFDFEDAHMKQHGYRPLNPGTAEYTDGPSGST